jgi:AraC-like DNA-binding protein
MCFRGDGQNGGRVTSFEIVHVSRSCIYVASFAQMYQCAVMVKSRIEQPDALEPLDLVWYGARFSADFIYDRPFGAGDGALHFFHFRNAVTLLDAKGEQQMDAGSAIVYSSVAPQRFQGKASSDKQFVCDHVCFAAATESRFKQFGVPFDCAFMVKEPQAVMDTILNLRSEERVARVHWRRAAYAYRSILMLQLAREASRVEAPLSSPHDERIEQIVRDVCAMIDRNPSHPWVVAELAQIAGLSRGRFSAQFKRFAEVPPQEYAINARLREARMLLTNTSLSVGDIAERCGFRSAYYMSRLFTKRIGCPPSHYAERFHVSDS